MSNKKTIAIVGGGITGLTAAYYLQRKVKEEQLPYHIVLIEANDELGGKIKTVKRDGYVIERGPDSFLARKHPAVKLAKKLGIADELVRNTTGQAYILVGEKLHKMPKGSYMGVPTDLEAFMKTDLLSEEGKERVKKDLILQKTDGDEDQSLGQFFRYRFGDELVENVMEPLLSGVYSGDLDQMSLFATFPQFYELEQQYGSLIKGFQETLERPHADTGKKPGQFLTFKNGLQTLVECLEKAILQEVEILYDKVTHIERVGEQYRIDIQQSDQLQVDVVIMATPHQVLPKVFPNADSFDSLLNVPSNSVANVVLAFDESAIEQSLDGTGFVVSRNSPYRITACTWTYRKWKTTTPEGKVLLRAYVGKPGDQEVVQLSDDEITRIVLNELAKTMTITKSPEFTLVTRWKNAMPQYTVGHTERIRKIRCRLEESLPGVFLAGSSFGGVGIPDCIEQAEKVVEASLTYLKE